MPVLVLLMVLPVDKLQWNLVQEHLLEQIYRKYKIFATFCLLDQYHAPDDAQQEGMLMPIEVQDLEAAEVEIEVAMKYVH